MQGAPDAGHAHEPGGSAASDLDHEAVLAHLEQRGVHAIRLGIGLRKGRAGGEQEGGGEESHR